MVRTQIYLSETMDRSLRQVAKKTGRSKSELIRRAIDQALVNGIDQGGLVEILRRSAGAGSAVKAVRNM